MYLKEITDTTTTCSADEMAAVKKLLAYRGQNTARVLLMYSVIAMVTAKVPVSFAGFPPELNVTGKLFTIHL